MENVSFIAALGAGLASFLSPCVLPMVPVYLVSLVGSDMFESNYSAKRRILFLHSLSFVLGFTFVFTAMGALVGLAGININPNSIVVQRIVGSLLILFGFFMLATLKIPWLNMEKRLSPSLGRTSGYLRSFLTGAVFTLAWTPCISPILGSILAIAFNSETAWNGVYLLLVFSIGMGVPFLIIGAAFDTLIPFVKCLNRYTKWIYVVSGVLLIALGVIILSGNILFLIP